MKKTLILAMLTLLPALQLFSQNNTDWEPTGVWPFINKQFRTATVYTGVFSRTKTIVPCNIHVGKQTLWYSQNDTLMEAIPGSVLYVEFPNGDTYMPIGSERAFGRIIREDTIDGQVARIICVKAVDKQALDQRGVDVLNNTQNFQQGAYSIGLGSWASAVSDANNAIRIEEQPLPMTKSFYFQVRGEMFPATTKQILGHIDPSRRKEYHAFTRSAEIISTNESSMLKVWKEFFIKSR